MICKDWTQLATSLDMTEDIDFINIENDSLFDKARVVLTKWKQKFVEKATLKRLIQALRQIQRQDIVNQFQVDKV